MKSPSDNKEQKKFLGYEWSAAKGSEGIKLNTDSNGNHTQPLYDPINRDNPEKISFLIAQNFLGNELNLSGFEDLVSTTRLIDMLDFSRIDFDKTISLTDKKSIVIETKWNLVKLGEVAEIQSGGTPSSTVKEYWDGDICWATLVDTKQKYLTTTQRKITEAGLKNSSAKLLPINTVIFSSRATIGDVTIAKVETATNQGYKNFICNEKINHEFLYEILKYYTKDIASLASGMTFKEISKTEISNFKIPLPDKDIQEKIVVECEAVDKEVENAEKEINHSKDEIENKIIGISTNKYPDKKVSEIAHVNPSKSELKNVDENTLVSFVEMASVSNDGFIQRKEDRPLKDLRKGSYTYFKENDVIIAKITPCMENGKCALATGLTNYLAMGSSEFHVIRCKENVLPK